MSVEVENNDVRVDGVDGIDGAERMKDFGKGETYEAATHD